jgi:predicted Ser/Thr protein kinase
MLFKSLIKRILDKLLPSRLAVAEKTEITEMLVDMQNRVEAGTKKIDEQIPVLQKILKDIESKDEAIGIIQSGDDPAARGFAKLEFTSLDKKLEEFATKTGSSKEEAREALVDAANEAYPPGSPKIMRMDDDEMLEAYIDTREKMGMKMDLLEDIVDRTGTTIKEESAFDLIRKGIEKGQIKEASMSVDDALKANKQKQADLKAVEEKMADIKNFDKMTKPGGLAKLMQEVQDEKVIDLEKFRKAKDPVDKNKGGRVPMQFGGMLKGLLSLMRKGDEQQIKNVIRDPKTDLSRRADTPEGKPTIADMEDLPGKLGYDKTNKMKLEKFVERERVRALLADRMGVDPKEISDSDVDMAIREGFSMFSQGGGVGSLFKRKAK